jgi:hypothetical protein
VAILKGRANYVCHYHLKRALNEGRLMSRDDARYVHLIQRFAETSQSGDKSELADVPENATVWLAVTSTRDNCLGSDCPDYKECFVMEARKKALAAEVVVVNHHLFFADVMLRDEGVAELLPSANTVIFDEAQRAWNKEQTSSFMKRKRGQDNFSMSEPDFLLSVMNRHKDWCVVVCLIGGGQEINTGEAGITEWITALKKNYQDWEIHFSDEIFKSDYALSREWLEDQGPLKLHIEPDLNLSVSLRSFRAEKLSTFISAIISGDAIRAREIKEHLTNYPIYLTRDLEKAKDQLRQWARGSERIGLVASSNAIRLKPSGIFVKGEIDPTLWFLKGKSDIRSSHYLEDVATEFDVQGLEIDWVGVCWDANFRVEDGKWITYNFSGSKWQSVHDLEKQKYIANSYRVLLTRGRQGIVIFVPDGNDADPTRKKTFYDQTYDFLKICGIGEI